MLDPRLFDELRTDLDNETFSIFNYIINENKRIHNEDVYYPFLNDLKKLQEMNGYLYPDSFDDLRTIIAGKDIRFINSNILDLKKNLDSEKFDMILLSNISDYTHRIFEGNDLAKYRNLIDELTDNLNPGGIIQVGYIYTYYSGKADIGDFSNPKIRQSYFPIDTFPVVTLNSYYLTAYNDKVVTYKKIK